MTADEVRRLGEGTMLAIMGNRRPLLVKKYRYSFAPKAAGMTALGPARSAPPPLPLAMPLTAPLVEWDMREEQAGIPLALPGFRLTPSSKGTRKKGREKTRSRRRTMVIARPGDPPGK